MRAISVSSFRNMARSVQFVKLYHMSLSQIVDVHLVRDKKTGQSKGYAFLGYEDQRSTALAVDNFNGYELLGR